MTTDDPPGTWESLPTKRCRACEHDVPAGSFCGVCGAALYGQDGGRTARLRLRAYATAPHEHVLRPSLITSSFPQLPRRSRPAFRLGLIVVVALLVAFVLLRWQPPLIGIAVLGLPLLFVVYLKETDAFDDLSTAALWVTGAMGVIIGTGWTMATDAIWARTYDDVLATPMTTAQALVNLAVVPACGVLLMLLPAVLVRLWRPGARESLDGFVIGALGALCFTAAGILTRAAPEFANGLVAEDVPVDALAALAAIRGAAAPLTAIAIGGLVGATLWFDRRTDPDRRRHWYSLNSPAPAVTIALLVYAGQNGVDFAWISYAQIVGLYAAITVLALLALRITLQATMLGERSEGISPTHPVLCPECDSVVPDQAFCVNCGIAATAASRTSRRARRIDRPIPITAAGDAR